MGLGREERLEQMLVETRVDSRPLVLDDERDAAVTRPAHANRDTAALRHGFARIANQIEQRLADLPLVGEHRRKVGGNVELELDPVLLELPAHELRALARDAAHVFRLQIERPLPGEREVLLAQTRETLDLAPDGTKQGLRLGVRVAAGGGRGAAARAEHAELLFEQLEIQSDRGQGIPDLVGHVRRHLAHGRESLRNDELRVRLRNRRDHALERDGELADLVVRLHGGTRFEIAPRDCLGPFRDACEGFQHAPRVERHEHADQHRDGGKHGEQPDRENLAILSRIELELDLLFDALLQRTETLSDLRAPPDELVLERLGSRGIVVIERAEQPLEPLAVRPREAFDFARRRDQRLADEHALAAALAVRDERIHDRFSHAVETSWTTAELDFEPDALVGGVLRLRDVVELRVPGVLRGDEIVNRESHRQIPALDETHLARGGLLREQAEAGGKRERERDDRVGDEHACGDAPPKRGAFSALSHSKRLARESSRGRRRSRPERETRRGSPSTPSRSCRRRAVRARRCARARSCAPPAEARTARARRRRSSAPPRAVPLELGGRRAQRLFEDPPRLLRDAEAARETAGVVIAHRGGRVAQALHAIEPGGAELGERDGALVAKLERAAGVRDEQRAARDLREQRASLDASALLVAGEPSDQAAAPLGLGNRSREDGGDPASVVELSPALLDVPAAGEKHGSRFRVRRDAAAVRPSAVVGKRPKGALGPGRREPSAVGDAAGRFERRNERVLVLTPLPTPEAAGARPRRAPRDRDPGRDRRAPRTRSASSFPKA